ncbi:MAG: hypothetical protein J5667_04090 [Bacteroidales bacterium]|nr:hypothetical protein [Bacteroidales bacterium]
MAQLLGISRQAYINIETGKTALINKQIIKMSQKCDLTLERILFGHLRMSDTVEVLVEENDQIISALKNKLDTLIQLLYTAKQQILMQSRQIEEQRARITQLLRDRNHL